MKKQLLTLILGVFAGVQAFATQHVITNSGNNFVPNNINVAVGDTVIFGITSMHNARQVSLATYTANDTIALPGGFEIPYGGGMWVASSIGTVYYVCVPHAQSHQMKGIINVGGVGVEDNKNVTMTIMQSVADQYLKLVVTGGAEGLMSVEMMNLSGQVVKTLQIHLEGEETSTIIQVGDMPKGVYMIRWSYGNINRAKKIILQ